MKEGRERRKKEKENRRENDDKIESKEELGIKRNKK